MFRTFALFLVWLAGAQAMAADALTAAMQQAYAPYRAALMSVNTGVQAQARDALGKAQASWQAVVQQYGDQPPPPYQQDPMLRTSLEEVSAIYAQAAAEVEANRLPQAHALLKQAPKVMADIRRRNQVVTFSDHVMAYHLQMESVLTDGPKLLAEPQGRLKWVAQVGALAYLADRLKAEAPAALRGNPEFLALQTAVAESVAQLQNALFAGDDAATKPALAQVKTAYSKLFAQFG